VNNNQPLTTNGTNVTLQRTLLFLFILLTCLIGCNEDPDIVGVGLLPQSDFGTLHTDTVYATSDSLEQNLLYTGYISSVALGKDNYSEAWMFIKFWSWPDSLNGVTIKEATIRLKTMYHFGDTLGTLSFNMYRAAGVWTGDSLTYSFYDHRFGDSLSLYPQNYYNASKFQTAFFKNDNDNSQFSDTDWVHVSIEDTAMVREWFVSEYDTNSLNQGVLLIPTNSTMLKGFYSFNASNDTLYPELVVTYEKDGYTNTYTHAYGYTKYIPVQKPIDLTIQAKFANPSNDSLTYIQNGTSYRSVFRFDTLHIPATSLIHRANLEVTLNQSKSIFNTNHTYLRDSLFSYYALTDTSYYSSSGLVSLLSSQDPHVYQLRANSYVATWLKNPALLRKVVLTGYSESSTFDRFALYGAKAALTVRPRLIITYSTSK
jgi:hypothetical protein